VILFSFFFFSPHVFSGLDPLFSPAFLNYEFFFFPLTSDRDPPVRPVEQFGSRPLVIFFLIMSSVFAILY